MSSEITHLVVGVAGWLIAGLLGINIFFVREFMKRMEKSIEYLTLSISNHSLRLGEVDKNFTEKFSRLDEKIHILSNARKAARA
jgi:1,2-phenylacetyl-CoA epoxidase catalytic subunit